MSTKTHDSDQLPPMQEVDLNDTAWNEVVSTRLPSTLARPSPPVAGLDAPARSAQRQRFITRLISIRLLPVLFPRIGDVGSAQRRRLAV